MRSEKIDAAAEEPVGVKSEILAEINPKSKWWLSSHQNACGIVGCAAANRADAPLSVEAGGGLAPGPDVLKNGAVRQLAPLLWAG
jgi:hypothetical protein